MAGETLYDAMKRSRNSFQTLVLKAIVTSDELFSVMPFIPKAGEAFVFSREKALGSFTFLADDHSSVAVTGSTTEQVTVSKRQAAESFSVPNFAQENLADLISPMNEQTIGKLKAAGRALANKFITGGNVTGVTVAAFQSGAYVDALVSIGANQSSDRQGVGSLRYTHTGTFLAYRAPGDRTYGPNVACAADGNYTLVSDNPSKWIRLTLDVSDATADTTRDIALVSSTNEVDGLKQQISLSQIRSSGAADGDQISFSILDELIDSVKYTNNLAFVCNSAVRRKIRSAMRSLDGRVESIKLPNSDKSVMAYNEIPILKNDWITSDESKGAATTLSSVYLVNLDPMNGFYCGALGGGGMTVDSDPRESSVMGFRLYDLGHDQAGPNQMLKRLAWYGGTALGSDLAAARAKEIITG